MIPERSAACTGNMNSLRAIFAAAGFFFVGALSGGIAAQSVAPIPAPAAMPASPAPAAPIAAPAAAPAKQVAAQDNANATKAPKKKKYLPTMMSPRCGLRATWPMTIPGRR